ncbi:YcxB family protein [Proteocatella sphenisci]|uniref:YcxB family protein n=1 Tax=Proteocatella sphenisci TaxID=181070 RepID=UPI0004BCAD1E|nr:YcxB family protein [Proteocatella sphenisci]
MNTEFKYELLEEDFIQSNLDYVKISPNFAKQMRVIKYGFVVIVAFMIIFFMRSVQGAIFGILIAALYSLGFDKYYKHSVKRRVKKSITAGHLQLNNTSMTTVVSDAGIVIKGKKEKTKYTWKDIKMLVESPKYIYLISEQGSAEIIPKRDQDYALIKSELVDRAKASPETEFKTIS